MIAAFEQRLATVLGSRLAAPFAGRVQVTPGAGLAGGPHILVASTDVAPAGSDFGIGRRPEPTTQDLARRLRVLRLAVTVELRVVPSDSTERSEAIQGMERVLYAIETADIAAGRALDAAPPADLGFRIARLGLLDARAPTLADDDGAAVIHLRAEGWFWPAGAVGETGPEIQEVRLRAGFLSLRLVGGPEPLIAGGAAAALRLESDAAGEMRLRADAPPAAAAFGTLSLALRRADGSPGVGSLTGGAAGPGGTRLVPLTAAGAVFGYTPPAAAGSEDLLIRMADPDGAARGAVLGRFPLRTAPA
ncbi:hypothetical protein C8P66_11732 [Humitalea rosea]|uniref:Uncharacterized protein n=1 Tax=Humitalea rosea TaxID=990373 RepID=A0A2W7IU55_9PROT|nr:hypothetical protein [Humitalea rosea]PZW43007.1 hypothetical protein C8P66_11732 [Humitalea rosea]